MKYQPDQSILDYSDWDIATSSAITGDFTTDSLKYGFGPTSLSAESPDEAKLREYERTYGKEQAKIRMRLKKSIMKRKTHGTKAGQWSARKSQLLKEEYEAACEKAGLKPYKGSKTESQQNLSDWSDQDWRTASGGKSSKTGEPYFPAKAVAALKEKGLYAKAKRQKAAATKAGKQHADYSEDIEAVVRPFRSEGESFDIHWYIDDSLEDYIDESMHDTHSCFDFAEMLYANLVADGIEAEIQAPSKEVTAHRWVYVPKTGLCYDAYTLDIEEDGTEDWKTLSFWSGERWNDEEEDFEPYYRGPDPSELGEAVKIEPTGIWGAESKESQHDSDEPWVTGERPEAAVQSEIVAGYHDDAYGDLGCPRCRNIDYFWKTTTSKGKKYRCLMCEYTDDYETVKSQGDITLEKFGLTVECPICEESISAYNQDSIRYHLKKHEPKVSEAEDSETDDYALVVGDLSDTEQLSLEIEDIDENYGLLNLSEIETSVQEFAVNAAREMIEDYSDIIPCVAIVFVSETFSLDHVARYRSQTVGNCPIVMLSLSAIKDSAFEYDVPMNLAVATSVWHELGHALDEYCYDYLMLDLISESGGFTDAEVFAESFALWYSGFSSLAPPTQEELFELSEE